MIGPEDLTEFYEEGLAGFVITDPSGAIVHLNKTAAAWFARPQQDLIGRRFSDYLAVSGKIYLETHLMPLLRVIGSFDEVALDIAPAEGARIPVLVNGRERRDADGCPVANAFIIFKSVERLRYEKDILFARNELQSINATLENRVRNEVSERLTAQGMYTAERETAILRERFIAVLGHDLRNPLAAMAGGLRLLGRKNLDPQAANFISLMTESVRRMNSMVGDLMDFARGRLTAGMALDRKPAQLEPVIALAVHELQAVHAGQQIHVHMDLPDTVDCDIVRIAQLVSNLLGNALTHGLPHTDVSLDAKIAQNEFELAITNQGTAILPDVMDRIFEPFVRLEEGSKHDGLGLGLYISSEIARGHGGRLSASSIDGKTTFVFRMPQRAT